MPSVTWTSFLQPGSGLNSQKRLLTEMNGPRENSELLARTQTEFPDVIIGSCQVELNAPAE